MHNLKTNVHLISRARGFAEKGGLTMPDLKILDAISTNHLNQYKSVIFLYLPYQYLPWQGERMGDFSGVRIPAKTVAGPAACPGANEFLFHRRSHFLSAVWPGFVEKMRRIATEGECRLSGELPAFQVGICSIP